MCSIAGVFHSDLVTVEYQACGCDLPNSLQLDSATVLAWEIPHSMEVWIGKSPRNPLQLAVFHGKIINQGRFQ